MTEQEFVDKYGYQLPWQSRKEFEEDLSGLLSGLMARMTLSVCLSLLAQAEEEEKEEEEESHGS